jgi:hypothetical protein
MKINLGIYNKFTYVKNKAQHQTLCFYLFFTANINECSRYKPEVSIFG